MTVFVTHGCLEKKRKEKTTTRLLLDYAFRRQFNEKPSTTPGCPGAVALLPCRRHHDLIMIGQAYP